LDEEYGEGPEEDDIDGPEEEPKIDPFVRATVAVGIAAALGVLTIVFVALGYIIPAIFTTAVAFIGVVYGAQAAVRAREAGSPEPWRRWAPATLGRLDRLTRFASGFLAAVFAYSAATHLGRAPFAVTRYAAWHYPDELRWIVGVVELIGAFALLVPETATTAAVILMPIMLASVYTLAPRSPALTLIPIIVLGLLAFVAWERSRTRVHWLEARAAHPTGAAGG